MFSPGSAKQVPYKHRSFQFSSLTSLGSLRKPAGEDSFHAVKNWKALQYKCISLISRGNKHIHNSWYFLYK